MSKKIISFFILLAVLLSFYFTPIELNSNGLSMVKEIGTAAITPNLLHIPQAIEAAIITLAYAGASVSLAIIIALILSFFASNILTKSIMISKVILRFFASVRAVHELIWALFFVSIFGLQPMSAILALSLPFIGMLGKVFTDIFLQLSTEDIKYLQTNGASKTQILMYGYLPTALPQLLSYSIYRFECAIRSSAILSFVGIGGLGLKIQLMLGDLRFNEMFTYIYMMVLIIGIIEIWSNRHKLSTKKTILAGLLISIISWLFILFYEGALYDQLITSRNLNYAFEFIRRMLGFKESSIAFFEVHEISKVLLLTLQTLQMSLLSISIAGLFMVLTVTFNTKYISNKVLYRLSRLTLLVTRAIPELIWAMIFVFIFKPGIWPGALALAIHNYGIVTKLCAEVIESENKQPFLSIQQSGGNKILVLIYGIFPSVVNRFISYIIYRWEIILRTTIIVGMVGAGGLGYYFKLHFSLFHYTNITLVIFIYLILVRFADFISKKLTLIYR